MPSFEKPVPVEIHVPLRYRDAVDQAVANTPASRNRVVDTWRAGALLVVVFGHWLAASVWIQPDGTVVVMNTSHGFRTPAGRHGLSRSCRSSSSSEGTRMPTRSRSGRRTAEAG